MGFGNNVFGGDNACNGSGLTKNEFVQDEPATHGGIAKQDKRSLGECRSSAPVTVVICESNCPLCSGKLHDVNQLGLERQVIC
jgi:hypothetical protein